MRKELLIMKKNNLEEARDLIRKRLGLPNQEPSKPEKKIEKEESKTKKPQDQTEIKKEESKIQTDPKEFNKIVGSKDKEKPEEGLSCKSYIIAAILVVTMISMMALWMYIKRTKNTINT